MMKNLRELVRFGLVGIVNTIITYAVILILTLGLNWHYMAANVAGYAAGIINSFFMNRTFTFKSKGGITKQAFRFGAVTAVCYLLQAGLMVILVESVIPLIRTWPFWLYITSGGDTLIHSLSIRLKQNQNAGILIMQLIGMVFYTLAGYVGNRYFTFHPEQASGSPGPKAHS